MNIPVTYHPSDEQLSVVINDECDHAGAEVEVVTYAKLSWWDDAHTYVPDDSEDLETLICPCGYELILEPEEPDYE